MDVDDYIDLYGDDDKKYDAFVVSIFFILFSFWFTHFFFILTF